jgi:hypothetical protein
MWLSKWIKDPRSVRYNSAMTAFASHSNADALVEDVLTYLKTMAQHKQRPNRARKFAVDLVNSGFVRERYRASR